MDCKFLHCLCFDLKIKAKNSNNPPREKMSRTAGYYPAGLPKTWIPESEKIIIIIKKNENLST